MSQQIIFAPAENVRQLEEGYIIDENGERIIVRHIDSIAFTPDGSKIIVVGPR